MQRIFTHIERLLLTNDCVIIPEFGGFVLHPCPASYQPDRHRFCPPEKGIVFNPTLNHYDKLIPESYIQMYGMTIEEAHLSLRKDIEELRQGLENEGLVYFDKAGFLRKDDAGKLFFETALNSSFAALKPFGLYPFHLPPVAQDVPKAVKETSQTIKPETKQKRMVYMPLNSAWLRVAGLSAAAVALFLLISTPVDNVGNSSYSASMISPEIMTHKVCTLDSQNSTTQEPVIEVEVTKQTVISEEIPLQQPQPVTQASKPTTTTVETTQQKIFYAIIGSFTSENQANRYIQQVSSPELTNIGLVINEERVRVYADKFSNRTDAQNYILHLKANERFKDTWLFVGQ